MFQVQSRDDGGIDTLLIGGGQTLLQRDDGSRLANAKTSLYQMMLMAG
jgi:hypothetical protein